MFISSIISTGLFLLIDRSLVLSCWGPTWRWADAHYSCYPARGRHSKHSGVDLKHFNVYPHSQRAGRRMWLPVFPCLLWCLKSHDNSLQSHLPSTIALPLFYFWYAWESAQAQVRTPSLAKSPMTAPSWILHLFCWVLHNRVIMAVCERKRKFICIVYCHTNHLME